MTAEREFDKYVAREESKFIARALDSGNVRTFYDPSCQFCRANHGEMFPPHDASDNCESGKRAHCSCDVCF